MRLSRNNLFLIFLLIWNFYFGLTSYGILNNNEGLYAQIAWEMLQRNDFVIPFLNGVPYIEKPPLLYWFIAFLYAFFGKSVFAARFIPTTFGMLTCLSLYLFSKKLRQEKLGFYASLLLGSSLGFIIFSRMVFFDILLTAFFTFAVLCFFLWNHDKNKNWLRLGYGFSALALLTKGFLSIVLIGLIFLIFFTIKYKNLKWIFEILDLPGILLFFSIAAPWHILASYRLPEFAWFYFINEHVLRFLDMRIPRDYYRGPFYYYLMRIPAYFLPWTLIFPWLLKGEKINKNNELTLLCWIWFLTTFIFFTISRAKANYYMALGMPPVALLIAQVIQHHQKTEIWMKIGSLLSAFVLFVGSFYVKKIEAEINEKALINNYVKKEGKSNLYLYKRYELVSSSLFYYDKRLPIINSDSKDLWFGSTTSYGKDWFIDWNKIPQHNPIHILVHEKDRHEFEGHCPLCSVLYEGYKTTIYKK
jgi:4-amino-4-deoxy-L-arabinose transferase-like glycosyltransferase